MTSEAVSIQAAASVASGMNFLSNPTGFWQMINMMQLFMLILLLDFYLPIKILDIFNSSSGFNIYFMTNCLGE
jgi:hypothetical protein